MFELVYTAGTDEPFDTATVSAALCCGTGTGVGARTGAEPRVGLPRSGGRSVARSVMRSYSSEGLAVGLLAGGFVGGTGDSVGGIGVSVGGAGVGGVGVSIGETGVSVGGKGVTVGGNGISLHRGRGYIGSIVARSYGRQPTVAFPPEGVILLQSNQIGCLRGDAPLYGLHGTSQAVEVLDRFHIPAAVIGGIGAGLYIVPVRADSRCLPRERVAGGRVDRQGQGSGGSGLKAKAGFQCNGLAGGLGASGGAGGAQGDGALPEEARATQQEDI